MLRNYSSLAKKKMPVRCNGRKKLSNLYLYLYYLIIYNLYLIINRQKFMLFFSSILFFVFL